MKKLFYLFVAILIPVCINAAQNTTYFQGTVDGGYAYWRNFPGTQQISSVEALKNLEGMKDADMIYLRGENKVGDGGHGRYYYDADSVLSPDGMAVIRSNTGSGAWIRVNTQPIVEELPDFLPELENNQVFGPKMKIRAGYAMGISAYSAPYYIKNTDGEPRVYIYRAGEYFLDNDDYAPLGIVCMDDLPCAQGDYIAVTTPGADFVFRNDDLQVRTEDYGRYYFCNKNGGWTPSAGIKLSQAGDVVIAFGVAVGKNMIASNPHTPILERQADSSLTTKILNEFGGTPGVRITDAWFAETATTTGNIYYVMFDRPATREATAVDADFAVSSGGSTYTPTYVEGSGTDQWQYDSNGSFFAASDVKLSYNPSGANQITGLGEILGPFSDYEIDTQFIGSLTPPTIVSAVYSDDGTTVDVTFDRAVKRGAGYPDESAADCGTTDATCTSSPWIVSMNGYYFNMVLASGNDSRVWTLSHPRLIAAVGDAIQLEFRPPAADTVLASNNETELAATTVSVTAPQYGQTAPVITSAAYMDDGQRIQLTFDQAVAKGDDYPATPGTDNCGTTDTGCTSSPWIVSMNGYYFNMIIESGEGTNVLTLYHPTLVAASTDIIQLEFRPPGPATIVAFTSTQQLAATTVSVSPPGSGGGGASGEAPLITNLALNAETDQITVSFDKSVSQGASYPSPDGTAQNGPWRLAYSAYPDLGPWYPTCVDCNPGSVWVLNAGLDTAESDPDIGINLSYVPTAGNVVEATADGVDMAPRENMSMGVVDVPPPPVVPVITRAQLNQVNRRQIFVHFSSPVQKGVSYSDTDFAVTNNTVTGVTGDGTAIWTITVSSLIAFDASVNLTFTQPGNSVESTTPPDYVDVASTTVGVNTAQVQTTSYYLRQNGAGANAGASGTWSTAPTSDANAMSLAQFNDPANWSTTESDSKIDPDDVVFIKGGGWTTGVYIRPQGGCIIDGYEAGTYQPLTNPGLSGPTEINGGTIIVEINDVTIQDLKFPDRSNPYHNISTYDGNPASAGYWDATAKKIENLTVRNCHFYKPSNFGGGSAIRIWFAKNVLIRDNRITGQTTTSGESGSGGEAMNVRSATNLRIINNYLSNNHHGLLFIPTLNMNGERYTPPNNYELVNWEIDYVHPTYGVDPDAGFHNLEVAYNWVGYRGAEGISYDGMDSGSGHEVVDVDTIESISGNSITLSNANWAGSTTNAGKPLPDYSGLYMVSYDFTDMSNYGTVTMITGRNGKTFTVQSSQGFRQGQKAAIGMINHFPWYHHNRLFEGGYGLSSMLFEDLTIEGIMENNYAPPRPEWYQGWGGSVNSIVTEYFPMFGVRRAEIMSMSIKNIIRNNTCGEFAISSFCQGTCNTSPLYAYANAVYDNILWRAEDGAQETGQITLANGSYYADNNKWFGQPFSNQIYDGDGANNIATVDHTTTTPGRLYANHYPNIVKTVKSGNAITVTFTRNINGGIGSGGQGFTISGGNSVTINSVSGTNGTNTRVLNLNTAPTAGSFLYYNEDVGDIVASSDTTKALPTWSIVGHDLMTEY